jgi:glycosyltransferase 2 family protein
VGSSGRLHERETQGSRTTRLAPTILIWLGIAVSAGFAYLAVRDVDFAEVWKALKETQYAWLAPALALIACWFFLRAVRWQLLFAPDRRPAFAPTARALFVGYFVNNIAPVRAGEVAKTAALSRWARAPLAETSATVIVERAFDVLSLLVLLFVSTPWLPHVGWLKGAAWLAAVVAVALLALILVFVRYGERPLRPLFRPLARLPFVPAAAVQQAPRYFLEGLAGLLRAGQGLAAFALTCLSWLVLAVGFWLVMVAFDLGLSPLAGLLVVIAIGLALILPSSPAGLGVFEGATVVALSAYGIEDSRAFSFALVLHALNSLPFIIIGIPWLGRSALVLRRAPDAAPAATSLRT